MPCTLVFSPPTYKHDNATAELALHILGTLSLSSFTVQKYPVYVSNLSSMPMQPTHINNIKLLYF